MITLIAGAGPGLGLALARRFGRGADRPDEPRGECVLLVRSQDVGDGLVTELAGDGIPARAFAVDLSDQTALRATLRRVLLDVGLPDVAVANASLGAETSPDEVTVTDIGAALSVGTYVALALYQELVPGMRSRGSGTLIVTGSGVALRPWPGTTALSIDKAAARAFALAAARHEGSSGVVIGTVTVDGLLGRPGFTPQEVAETFWSFHTQAKESPTAELVHRG